MKSHNDNIQGRVLGRLVAKELKGDALKATSGAMQKQVMASKTYTDSGGNGAWGDCDALQPQ